MNKKKLIFSTVAVLSLGISSAVFFNGTFDEISNSSYRNELCDKIYEVASSQLNHQQIINHASNRFGYGISPLETSLHPNNANADTARQIICNLADELSFKANRPLFNSDMLAFVSNNFDFSDDNLQTKEIYKYNPINDSYKSLSSGFEILRSVRDEYFKTDDTTKSKDAAKIFGNVKKNAENSSIQARLAVHAFGSQTIDVDSGIVRDKQVNLSSLLGEFWFNHFNVTLNKSGYFGGDVSLLSIGGYERTIYENQFGTFHELLKSVIYHPTMLTYLDNTSNAYVNKQASNQNLGRELLELHTFGQGPGDVYTQADVEMAALILAGLGRDGVRKGKINYLTSPNSEVCNRDGKLKSLNKIIDCKSKSYPEPELFSSRLNNFLAFLSSHKVTKQNICTKLVSRFVHQSSLRAPVVESCKLAWGKFGDLPIIYKSIVTHPNTWSPLNYRNKFKNPLELVISAIRASGLSVNQINIIHLRNFNNLITTLGLNYRLWTTPDGYKENSDWISQGYLIHWAKDSSVIVSSRKNDSFIALPKEDIFETLFGNLKPWVPDEDKRLVFEKKSPVLERISLKKKSTYSIELQKSALEMSISDHKFLMK